MGTHPAWQFWLFLAAAVITGFGFVIPSQIFGWSLIMGGGAGMTIVSGWLARDGWRYWHQSRRRSLSPPKPHETEEEKLQRMFPARRRERIGEESAWRVGNADDLLSLVKPWYVLIDQRLAAVHGETADYADEIVHILRTEITASEEFDRAKLPLSSAVRQRLEKLFTLLRGNDVSIYACEHTKTLPERWEPPVIPDPIRTQFQVILVFRPRAEPEENEISVQVDYGQPRDIPGGLPF